MNWDEGEKVGGKDVRPWRRVTLNLPDDKANLLEDALAMALHFNIANNRVEAVEAIATNFLIEYSVGPALWMHYAELDKATYKINSFLAVREAGYRCGNDECQTSKDLEVHHIWAKGCKDPDRPQWVKDDINHVDNLIPLCRACHTKIQPAYRDYIETYAMVKAKRKEEMRISGYITTKKHSAGKKAPKWS